MNKNSKSLQNFEKLLRSLFNDEKSIVKPKYIIEVDCQDAELLSYAMKSKISVENPLEVVALVLDPSKLDSIRSTLGATPHRIAQISNTKPQTIVNALAEIGITDPKAALYLGETPLNELLDDIQSPFGWVWLQANKEVDLIEMVSKGWFPHEYSFYRYFTPNISTLILFEKRPYTVRYSTLKDIPFLIQIEKKCSNTNILTPENVIADRIKLNPKGQFIIEQDGVIHGVLYTQRIADLSSEFDKQQSPSNSNGSIIQILSIFCDQLELEEPLLELVLKQATVTPHITDVIIVIHCNNYPGKTVISLEEYLDQKTPEGKIVDPIARMHVKHGAFFKAIIPNYFPRNLLKDDRGVAINYFLEYRIENRIFYSIIDEIQFKDVRGKSVELTPESIEHANRNACYPMPNWLLHMRWYRFKKQAIMPLDGFHVTHTLKQKLNKNYFDITFDTKFTDVMKGCANRKETFITDELMSVYTELHKQGKAHSVEIWREGQLVGGGYGLQLGGLFIVESLFHTMSDASKVAMAKLVDRLNEKGFALLDVQILSEHMAMWGAIEIPQEEYSKRLEAALKLKCTF